jgi:hypothetical protein
MSTAGWRESEEELQDLKENEGTKTPPHPHGVLKTEEVRVNYENASMISNENSIELAHLGIDK